MLPYYYVSDTGVIYNDMAAVSVKDIDGYLVVKLNTINSRTNKSGVKSWKNRNIRVHQLVATGFRYKFKKKGYQIHHKDFNRKNNDVRNLLWVSPKEHKKIHSRHYGN